MPGVYKRQETKHFGSFASDSAVLKMGDPAAEIGIVQNAQIQFSQSVARIYDVGNGGKAGKDKQAAIWYVGGRTQGQATLARILGPASTGLQKFYADLGDVCNVTKNDLTFTFLAGCEGTGTTTYTIKAAVMVNVGISVSAQDMIVNENVSLMFANLEVGPVNAAP